MAIFKDYITLTNIWKKDRPEIVNFALKTMRKLMRSIG